MIKRLSAFDSKTKQLGLLTILWLLVQGCLFAHYGIQPILESFKYIGAANQLIHTGHLPELRYYFYLTTTLLIAFCLKTGFGYSGVVVIQLVLNLLATYRFFNA